MRDSNAAGMFLGNWDDVLRCEYNEPDGSLYGKRFTVNQMEHFVNTAEMTKLKKAMTDSENFEEFKIKHMKKIGELNDHPTRQYGLTSTTCNQILLELATSRPPQTSVG